ncbi:MAG: OmpA family protein [Myxococcota bacterium]
MRSRFAVVVALALASGCLVPKKQVLALEEQRKSEQAACQTASEQQASRIADLEAGLAEREKSIEALEGRLRGLQLERDQLDGEVDSLTKEKAEWLSARAKLNSSIDETRQALREAQERKAATEARIAQYRDLLERFKTLIDAGKLQVKIVDGRMVVELATDVLFASGKADLSPDGEAAVKQVAEVFAQIPDQRYQVEGHTDNVPIKTAQFPSNWELASARAIRVVRALVDAGVPPDRVSRASFGEFRPVGDNGTKGGAGREPADRDHAGARPVAAARPRRAERAHRELTETRPTRFRHAPDASPSITRRRAPGSARSRPGCGSCRPRRPR